jgi:NAD(P)-dependent dehydrogenase (short-subunit alcohol dehydrogenase family)
MKPLLGQVAVVAGATRGAGRGIACMLGEAGATVYCSGRSVRGHTNTTGVWAGRPETIDETAEMVTAHGGVGIPVRTDHAVESEVAALFERVRSEQGRLDILVNVIPGPAVAQWAPFWKICLDAGRAMLEGWIWPHVVTCRLGAPLMVERRSGLIVEITERETLGYCGQLFYDLAVISLKRLAYDLAEELASDGVTALAVTPGFMRTEAILEQFGVTEANWRDAAETNARARSYGFAGSETPCFVGRAVAALAADPEKAKKTGGLYSSWDLSDEYGFTDIDGGTPHWGRYIAENFPNLTIGTPRIGIEWSVTHEDDEPQTPSETGRSTPHATRRRPRRESRARPRSDGK